MKILKKFPGKESSEILGGPLKGICGRTPEEIFGGTPGGLPRKLSGIFLENSRRNNRQDSWRNCGRISGEAARFLKQLACKFLKELQYSSWRSSGEIVGGIPEEFRKQRLKKKSVELRRNSRRNSLRVPGWSPKELPKNKFSVELWRLFRKNCWETTGGAPEELRRNNWKNSERMYRKIPGETLEEFPDQFWRNGSLK